MASKSQWIHHNNPRAGNSRHGQNSHFRRHNAARKQNPNNSDQTTPQDTKDPESNEIQMKRRRDEERSYRFKKVEELSQKDATAIILEITARESSFVQLLDSKMTSDTMVLVIRILAKVCSVGMASSKAIIMTMACKNAFHQSLQGFVLDLTVQDFAERKKCRYFWNDPKAFFLDAGVVFQALIESVPSGAYDVLPKTLRSFKVLFAALDQTNEEVKEVFNKLDKMLELCKLEKEKKVEAVMVVDEVRNEDDIDLEPPDNFRLVNIYPNRDDILLRRGFLRKNLIDKGYTSVNHYLDIQFRLLKEDFVGPLRDGIAEYLQTTGKRREVIKTASVRVYTNAKFISPIISYGQFGTLLQFQSVNKNNPLRMNANKRFMYGSLLCFTIDNFETLLFAKVIEKTPEMLKKGQVIVGFEPGENNYAFNESYVMVECSVYFEPYYQVLKALQNMDEDQFPMKKYLIELNPNIDPISYLPLDSEFKIDDFEVIVHDVNTWPNAEALRLNPTQYEAFRAALTKELAVIQGPPGTGKTYLGLKIAKALIANKEYWHNTSPILVICYTNHALDQFLEGLQETTTDIVRVGGQSKNKNMEKFSLREKRKLFRKTRLDHRALSAIEEKFFRFLEHINYYSDILKDIETNSVIIHFKKFEHVDDAFQSSWFNFASKAELIEWLCADPTAKDLNRAVRLEAVKKLWLNNPEIGEDLEEEFANMLHKKSMAEYELHIDVDLNLKKSLNHRLTSLQSIQARIAEIQSTEKTEENNYELQRENFRLESQLSCLQMRLAEGANAHVQAKPASCNLQNPLTMPADDRWQLYWYWLEKYRHYLNELILKLQIEYMTVQQQYTEIKNIFDLEVMKSMLVVGMTTTGAARLQTTLKILKCPIVIVEEAAEVLESHVVVALTSKCKHLILIGDHQQLRPATSDYYVERHFNLGISLFERMVRNNLQCQVLGVQHRMRPEFANLIVPAIYPKLENHPSVYDFPPVAGVVPSLYFIDHTMPETETSDSSKLNQHEATFLIALARYLIQNGYKSEDVTIIAAYSGQMFALWKEQKKCLNLLDGVRITVLDNYQGEESKIILLSLVRNNEQGKIGFLKIENRVCVALSRAKEGLYIMGNMDLLCQKSAIWPKVKEVLEMQGSLGKSLLLRCEVHADQETSVTVADDFRNVAEGGCNRLCSALLLCGHFCTMICHPLDRNHEQFRCKAKCSKVLCDNDHPCPNFCFEQCKPCRVLMTKTLPCNHQQKLFCHVDVNNVSCATPIEASLPCGHTDPKKPCGIPIDVHRCPFPCDTRVEPCGHACLRHCHVRDDPDHLEYKCQKECGRPRTGCSSGEHKCPNRCYEDCPPCLFVIEKRRSCTHKVEVNCNRNADEVKCVKKCKRMLACGHACKKKCNEPCGDCDVKVIKEVAKCGHKVRISCKQEPNRTFCYEKCPLPLRCGHICQNMCNQPCTESCKELVEHTNPTACGHKFKIECCMRDKVQQSNSYNLLKFCKSSCEAILSCSHKCSGTCGECAQGRIHKTCAQKCGATLVCGHPCPINCRDACQPCELNCSYRCEHSACRKKCGEPCTKCKEPCPRRCPHVKCTALCGDLCSVPPCTQPCPKKLPCGHACVGFCADPCPTLCRICNRDELTEVFFGDEDEETARFVMLEECKHIFESNGLNTWLQGSEEDQNQIAPKSCPRCKTILTSTQRYGDYIKNALMNLYKVKEKFFGNNFENEQRRQVLLENLNNLRVERALMKDTIFNGILVNFEKAIDPTKGGRRQPISLMLFTIYLTKLQIMQNIAAAYKKANLKFHKLTENINFLLIMLTKDYKRNSQQETVDITREVKRFALLVQLMEIRDSESFPTINENAEFRNAFNEVNDVLCSIELFTDDLEKTVSERLNFLIKTSKVFVSKVEFKQVVAAMKMAKGHWFKCPNGHPYAIGECGGAMATGRCADCGERIGGNSHALLPSNRHAGEVDGSAHPPFSEAANNLFNFGNLHDVF